MTAPESAQAVGDEDGGLQFWQTVCAQWEPSLCDDPQYEEWSNTINDGGNE